LVVKNIVVNLVVNLVVENTKNLKDIILADIKY
jgi:hypothetical protein